MWTTIFKFVYALENIYFTLIYQNRTFFDSQITNTKIWNIQSDINFHCNKQSMHRLILHIFSSGMFPYRKFLVFPNFSFPFNLIFSLFQFFSRFFIYLLFFTKVFIFKTSLKMFAFLKIAKKINIFFFVCVKIAFDWT